jgi:hypothetical protein
MRRSTAFIQVALVLSLAALSCSLPGEVQPTSAPTIQPTPPPTAVPAAPVNIPTEGEAVPASLPPLTPDPEPTPSPPPPSFNNVYFSAVDSGLWTPGEALLILLRYFTGEEDGSAIFGEQSFRPGVATGIVQLAQEYLDENPNAPEQEEIERLLRVLLPRPDDLAAYAAPEGTVFRPGPTAGLQLASFRAAPALSDEICDTLWRNGFPEPDPGASPPVCVLYRELIIGGKTFRIFYPREWAGTGPLMEVLEWAAEALQTSVETFEPLAAAGVPPTDLVFTQLAYLDSAGRRNPRAYAGTDKPEDSETCSVAIFPYGQEMPEGPFKQTLAHEIFHCYQFSNMVRPSSASYRLSKWWKEGSAEYFGNAAYPTVNAEYEYIPDLTENIGTTSLFQLDYENFLFFQFLANEVGNERVVEILAGLNSTGSPEAYAADLERFIFDFPQFYQRFGRAYVDRKIVDSGGGSVPVRPQPEYDEVVGLGTYGYTVDPFTVAFFDLKFPEPRSYTLSVREQGRGLYGARPEGIVDFWAELPEEIPTYCGEVVYRLLLTSTHLGGEYTLQVESEFEEGEGRDCDRCLVGTWQMARENIAEIFQALLPPNMRLLSVDGILAATFTQEGRVHNRWEDLTTTYEVTSGGETRTVKQVVNGVSNAFWWTEEGVIRYANSVTVLQMTIIANGMEVTQPMGDAAEGGTPTGVDTLYTCSGDELIATPQVEPLFQRVWRRVSP